MKATKINGSTDFNPIDIRITINNKRELDFLYHLFNAPGCDLSEFVNKMINNYASDPSPKAFHHSEINYYPIWKAIDSAITK